MSRLKKTFSTSQMEDVPMEIQTPHGHTSHWAMNDHCLEGQGWDGATQSIPYMKWCGQVVTLKENVLSIPNGRWPHDTPDSRWTLWPLRYGRPLSASRGMGGTGSLWVSLVWNDVVKISRLKETFWAFQMGDDPMTFKILRETETLPTELWEATVWKGWGGIGRLRENPWCEMVWSKYYT